ncbi:hypothetical protein KMW28_19380 [Flammeovirga yaeyamensis]|uniref:Porin n=1 Tax=Flammeovirga yaeyamensis TaxID=367791 RepID=A0AAX1N2N7_9BACT|nr:MULTISPECIES: hypothetical protein [Flammeovirga]ANQ50829.1 hypothetical protein MY04_3476 [Flammeovirga sp. MY04]MBB3700786.1 hypothetical protein [Flammeovirga yaeyamensis]NMF37859.1 hypothetical protein [Flammeovirga yaeyamensis]QWG01779.1 hypothetical protein KMW28_19380 [Flammeovirga yaeyamensis]
MRFILSVSFITLFSISLLGQNVDSTKVEKTTSTAIEKTDYQKTVDVFKRGIRLDLNKDKTSYFKFILGLQSWWRYGETNPGTINNVSKEPIDHYSDFAMRRIRTMFYLNVENKYLLFAQIGATSDGTYSNIFQNVYFHDFQGQIRIAPKNYFGSGLHFWQGLSRLSRVGSNNYLILDNPGFNFPEVNRTDAIVRQMGFFFRGVTLGKLGYQVSLNQPLITPDAGAPTVGGRPMSKEEMLDYANSNTPPAGVQEGNTYLLRQTNYNVNGYFYWQFWDIESQSVSGASQMNYFGQKRVFNIGAGFQYQPGGTATYIKDANGDWGLQENDITKIAVDAFLSMPLGHNGGGITAYGVFYNYQYGSNYLRTANVLGGFATGGDSPQGAGFASYSHGTGNIFHTEIGYTLPKSIYNSEKKIQPFIGFSWKDLEGLDEASWHGDFGANWAIIGQNVKVSAAYSLRPVYMIKDSKNVVDHHAGLFVAQLQLRI